jgi:glycosyltransferase involved in cell wall biosynthesis
MPRYSVVVPAYNACSTLAETLDAMLAQEFPDWECVVVDDGSTDQTPALAESYCERDGRFRLIRQPNSGTAGAYQSGIAASSADLLVICAADDFLLPEHLLVMDELIRRNPDCEIHSCNGEYLYADSGERELVYAGDEWKRERSLSVEQLVQECFFSVGAVIRRAAIESVGGHRIGVYVDDYDLWLRAMARGACHVYTPQVLAVHRISDSQQSASQCRVLESRIEVYENLLETEVLAPALMNVVQRKIALDRGLLAQCEDQLVLESQARALRTMVERVVGPNTGRRILGVLHRVSWITRPFRRAVARLRRR